MAFEMQDRLSALKHGSSQYGRQSTYSDVVQDEVAIEGVEGAEELEGFFHTVEDLGRAINQIGVNLERIKHNHGVILAAVKNQEAKEENSQLMEEVKKLSKQVHIGLKRLKQEIEAEEQGPKRNTADFRIRKAQFTTLSRKFHDLMGDYNSELDEYRDKNKDRIKRQLTYTGKNVSEGEVEEMLDTGNPNIFTQDILIDTAQKRQALNEVEARHLEIMELEKNIMELHEMFLDMALLVDEQGELVDRIEHNVEHAAVHVDHGRKEIRTAVHFQRKNRRLKWCICCVCTTVVVVVLVVIGIIIAVIIAMMD